MNTPDSHRPRPDHNLVYSSELSLPGIPEKKMEESGRVNIKNGKLQPAQSVEVRNLFEMNCVVDWSNVNPSPPPRGQNAAQADCPVTFDSLAVTSGVVSR